MTSAAVDVAAFAAEANAAARQGRTPMFVAVDVAAGALVVVADTVKPQSTDAVAQLHALGLQLWMLTGDNAATTTHGTLGNPASSAAAARRCPARIRSTSLPGRCSTRSGNSTPCWRMDSTSSRKSPRSRCTLSGWVRRRSSGTYATAGACGRLIAASPVGLRSPRARLLASSRTRRV